MRTTLAIARLALANAVRSRTVLTLLALLLFAIVALPLTIEGDGTLTGHVKIVLDYTLGAALAILSVATVWAGSASISTEIEGRQAHMLFTKPVRPFQVWLGKWLGLLAMNALLLGFSALVVYGLLQWTTRDAVLSKDDQVQLHEEVLVARWSATPDLSRVEQFVQEQAAQLKEDGHLPETMSKEQAVEDIREHVIHDYYRLGPGVEHVWAFPLSAQDVSEHPLLLKFKLSASRPGPQKLAGTWTFGTESSPAFQTVEGHYVSGQAYTVHIATDALSPGQVLLVNYKNNDDEMSALFTPGTGLTLHGYAGSFAMNFVRAWLLFFFRLAFLTALGVTAGSFLSTPIAVFAAVSAVLVMQLGPYMQDMANDPSPLFAVTHHHHHHHPGEVEHDEHGEEHSQHHPQTGLADHATRLLFRAIGVVLQPLQDEPVLNRLGGGEQIPWTEVGHSFLVKLLLYSGVLGAFAARMLARREIGLPV